MSTTSMRTMGQAYGALSTAAAMVAAARRDLDEIGAELRRRVEDSGASWRGHGGAAFMALGQAWSDREAVIVSALDRLESALRATEQVNLSTDDDESAALTRCRVRLG